jgi:hypothetical protein
MSDTKAVMRQSVSQAAERYSDSVTLRAGIALIPVVGGPIDAIVTTLASRAQAQRAAVLIDALKAEASSLRDVMISKEYLESEEWLDAVVAAFEAAARTRDREQIGIYARILIGAAQVDSKDLPDPRALLHVLSELAPVEIAIARLIADMPGSIRYDEQQQARREVTEHAWSGVLAAIPAAAKANLVFHLKRLERAGLISELTGAFGGSGGRHEPTPTLWRIIKFLREQGASDGSSRGAT